MHQWQPLRNSTRFTEVALSWKCNTMNLRGFQPLSNSSHRSNPPKLPSNQESCLRSSRNSLLTNSTRSSQNKRVEMELILAHRLCLKAREKEVNPPKGAAEIQADTVPLAARPNMMMTASTRKYHKESTLPTSAKNNTSCSEGTNRIIRLSRA